MKKTALPLLNEARHFGVEELFFSTTDRRGVITAGNKVFVRISGHPLEKLLGSPHNIIRHPDMPRAAFRLVWQRLLAGLPVAAYVKNLAADGRHYWVTAFITPNNGGFLSVRFKPTGPLLQVVEPLYAAMRAAETQAEERGASGEAVMDAGAAVLNKALANLHFADYEAFMRVMLSDEMLARDRAAAAAQKEIVRVQPAGIRWDSNFNSALSGLYRDGLSAYRHVNGLFARLDEFASLKKDLDRRTVAVRELTTDLSVSSINVALAATILGGEGRALQVISSHIGSASKVVSTEVGCLLGGVGDLIRRIHAMTFHLSGARLQLEMLLLFTEEVLADEKAAAERLALIGLLQQSFELTMAAACQEFAAMEEITRPLSERSEGIGREVLSLQVSQTTGVLEGSRISGGESVMALFGAIREQVGKAVAELSSVGDALQKVVCIAGDTPRVARAIKSASANMMSAVAAAAG